MKKVFFSAAAILALSLSAFANTPESKGEAKPEVKTSSSAGELHWFVIPASGAPVFQNTATLDEQEDMTGCLRNVTAITCESGYRDDQLNTPGNPSSGIKTAQINTPEARTYSQDN